MSMRLRFGPIDVHGNAVSRMITKCGVQHIREDMNVSVWPKNALVGHLRIAVQSFAMLC